MDPISLKNLQVSKARIRIFISWSAYVPKAKFMMRNSLIQLAVVRPFGVVPLKYLCKKVSWIHIQMFLSWYKQNTLRNKIKTLDFLIKILKKKNSILNLEVS